jgi:hypothetical protein
LSTPVSTVACARVRKEIAANLGPERPRLGGDGRRERGTAAVRSAFWDKRHGVWRVAEDDPDSALYAESADAAEVLGYMSAHS